ncbi:MAG: hypothetical protein ABSG15_00760 [FCB group bacterium]|jgi:hypothetical protein
MTETIYLKNTLNGKYYFSMDSNSFPILSNYWIELTEQGFSQLSNYLKRNAKQIQSKFDKSDEKTKHYACIKK